MIYKQPFHIFKTVKKKKKKKLFCQRGQKRLLGIEMTALTANSFSIRWHRTYGILLLQYDKAASQIQ